MISLSGITPGFALALLKVQGTIEGAIKDKANPGFRSKYADLGNCWDACREALQANSIAVLQFPCKADPGNVGMRTALVFAPTGEVISDEFQLPLKDPTNAQAGGSAITYARRYALCSVLGICPEDDDGNAASASPKNRGTGGKAIGEKQAAKDSQDAAGYRARFVSATSLDERKSLYTEVKNSSLSEPHRTELLKEMSDAIKSEKAATAKEESK